jgi:hypothetical protein
MTCERPAPIAKRIASSRRRPMARSSDMIATFTQAMSSTNAAAPCSTPSDSRMCPN